MNEPAARVVLGTAQLGMDYGIAHRGEQPAQDTADALIDMAWNAGVPFLDTAQAYGDSESVIGTFFLRNPDCRVRVISKLHPGLAEADSDQIYAAIRASADRLQGRLDAMMLHDARMLKRWNDGLGQALIRCREDGVISMIGVSVYTPDEFQEALNNSECQVIQAPFNALDRDLLNSGLFARAQELGVTLHLRSVFLQGLLLLDPRDLPPEMSFAHDTILSWRAKCNRWGREAADVALLFAAQAVPDAFLVLGCEAPDQLADNLNCLGSTPLEQDFLDELMLIPSPDQRVTRPYLWH